MLKRIKQNWVLIILIVFSLTPILWFLGRGNVLINGLDTNFPLDPLIWFERRLFIWNDTASTGEDFGSSGAGIFFHLLQVIPYYFGLSLQTTQIINLVFWFSLIIFSSYYLSKKIFTGFPLAQIVFVSLYSFNTYLFNTWENVKVSNLAVVSGIPLFLGVLISYHKKETEKSRLLLYTALISFVVSGSGINPAYFIAIIGAVVIFLLIAKEYKIMPLVLSIIFLINSFWIIPTVRQMVFSDNKITNLSDLGYTNWLDSLSENTNVFNVMRLQGAWDWYSKDDAGAPLYIPYATNYLYRFPFVAFSLLLVFLAMVGFYIDNKDRNIFKLFFAVLFCLGVFLGMGTHPPTGVIYEFFIKHIPFFSFFRSPWYIFTPYVTLAMSGLVAGIFILEHKIFRLAGAILILGNLIYNYPLVTGKIFRPTKSDGFYIYFPDYVFEAKKWLDQNKNDGRIIGYPGDEIEKFQWGYKGIDSFLNLFSSKETIYSSLNKVDHPSSKVIASFYDSLRKDQINFTVALAGKLNISTIFHKKDQESIWENLPQDILDFDHNDIGRWSFYQVPVEFYLPKIYSPEKVFFTDQHENMDKFIGFIPAKDVLVSGVDTVAKTVFDKDNIFGQIIYAENSQTEDYLSYTKSPFKQSLSLETKNLNSVLYTFEVKERDYYTLLLESLSIENFGLNPEEGINVEIDGVKGLLKGRKNGDLIIFEPKEFDAGKHRILINLENKNLLVSDTGKIILENKGKTDAVESIKINGFKSLNPYYIDFIYKNIYGQRSVFKVEQSGKEVDYKFQTEQPPFSSESLNFGFYFDPVPARNSYIAIKLIAMPVFDNPLGSKMEFSDIKIKPVFSNKLILVKDSKEEMKPANINYRKVSPVKYTGSVIGTGSQLIVFSENYSKDWELTIKNKKGLNLKYDAPHFSGNIYANVWYVPDMGGDYDFEIFYKPQKIYLVGLSLSAATLLVLAGFFIYKKYKS